MNTIYDDVTRYSPDGFIANYIVPYNYGWRYEDKFDKVEWNE